MSKAAEGEVRTQKRVVAIAFKSDLPDANGGTRPRVRRSRFLTADDRRGTPISNRPPVRR
jgi:hypothetical protein